MIEFTPDYLRMQAILMNNEIAYKTSIEGGAMFVIEGPYGYIDYDLRKGTWKERYHDSPGTTIHSGFGIRNLIDYIKSVVLHN